MKSSTLAVDIAIVTAINVAREGSGSASRLADMAHDYKNNRVWSLAGGSSASALNHLRILLQSFPRKIELRASTLTRRCAQRSASRASYARTLLGSNIATLQLTKRKFLTSSVY